MSTEELLAQARAAINDHQPETARSLLHTLLEIDPNHATAWYLLGRLETDPAQRRLHYERALEADPTHIDAREKLIALNMRGETAVPATQPAPARRSRAIAWQIGTIALIVIGLLTISSLRATPGAKPAAEQSPQERTTAFLQGMFTMIANPDFYDSDKSADLILPLLNEYVAPELRVAADTPMPDFGALGGGSMKAMTDELDGIHMVDLRYSVESQEADIIRLRIIGGSIRFNLKAGSAMNLPADRLFGVFELKQVDGVWYILQCGCADHSQPGSPQD